MKFWLIYTGELKATQRDPQDNQPDKMALHKQSIRKHFHTQLKQLWETDWFLSTNKVYPPNPHPVHPAGTAVWGAAPNEMIPMVEAVAASYEQYGYRFVPLVRSQWRLLCSLHILFSRRDPLGSVLHAGDLDNRVKTLIDTLSKPESKTQLRGNEIPAIGEDPFFVLLENDKLVSGITVETDRLLTPLDGIGNVDSRRIHAVITVDIRPYAVDMFNLSFSGA